MASSAPNKQLAARAAAVLTTGEVAATALDLNKTWGSFVTASLNFTLGSLTNVTVRFYVSIAGSTYFPIVADGGTLMTEVLTANSTRVYTMQSLAGWKYFRMSLQGSGTVTSSSAAITYRYLAAGTQGG